MGNSNLVESPSSDYIFPCRQISQTSVTSSNAMVTYGLGNPAWIITFSDHGGWFKKRYNFCFLRSKEATNGWSRLCIQQVQQINGYQPSVTTEPNTTKKWSGSSRKPINSNLSLTIVLHHHLIDCKLIDNGETKRVSRTSETIIINNEALCKCNLNDKSRLRLLAMISLKILRLVFLMGTNSDRIRRNKMIRQFFRARCDVIV